MKKTSVNSTRLTSSKRFAGLAYSLAVVLAVAGLLIVLPSLATHSRAKRADLKAPAIEPATLTQSQTATIYLHGTGPAANPPTLFLNATPPTATTEKFKDSAGITRSGGNPWKEVGTWTASLPTMSATLASLDDVHVWLGLKNSDDQGTNFDLRVEAYKNSTLVASGQKLCITGVTRNPSSAREVVLNFDPFSAVTFNGPGDVPKLKILTRVGTNATGGSCGGHNSAVGLRLYFDAVARSSRLKATLGSADTTPPALTVQQPANNLITSATQINVTGTFSDQSPTTISVNGVAATIIGNSFTATVPLAEGANVLNVVAVDAAGNQSTSARSIIRDTTAPSIAISQPTEGAVTNLAQVTVTGTFNDATTTAITVNTIPATVSGNEFTVVVPLAPGLNTLQAIATDAAANQTAFSSIVTRDNAPPVLNLVQPVNGLVSNSTSITVSGTATDLTSVAVRIEGQPVLVTDGAFVGELTLPEGVSQVHVLAFDAAGNQTELTRTVTADATEPVIADLTPAVGTLIEATSVTVQGRVTDVTAVTVKVGSVTASVDASGLFTANVPIVEGENNLRVSAVDLAGNASEAELLLEGKDLTPPAAPTVFAGQSPTRLAFQSIEGRAEPGTQISIAGGLQPVQGTAAAGTGLFVVNVELASGANALHVTSTDATNNVSPAISISITSDPNLPLAPDGQPSVINVATGDTQRGLIGAELPRPLIAIVRDKSGAPASNATVRFTVMHGGGQFTNGNSFDDVQTDAHGYASVRFVSGPAPGIALIRADFPGNLFGPTMFMAEALASTPGGVTSVSGTVRDANLRALPNVLVRISGQQTRTGADGRFRIENVAAGPHQVLELVGRDQITLPGRWPNISYDIDVLAGVDNNLGRQLFLPKVNDGVAIPLNANNVVTQDTSAQIHVVGGEPPIVITARAGTQVIFPPDVTDKRLSVTRIPVNRVPMPLEDGLATSLFISVQPSGAIFDQPLEVSFPNLDRLPPDSEVLLMSFDHDAGRYVQVGTGRVSSDGQKVTSEPGSGIRVGAWHALPRPPSRTGPGGNPPNRDFTILGQIQIAGNPELEAVHIDDILAQAGGNRAMVLTERAEWHSVDAISLRVRGTSGSDTPPPLAIDADVQTTVPEVKLEEVSFESNYALRKDDDSDSFSSPHWTAPAQPDPNYKGEPVAYEDDKKLKAKAKFSVLKEITASEKVKVRVSFEGNTAYDIPATPAKLDAKKKEIELKGTAAPTAFTKDTIDYYESMNLKWEVSLDDGTNWSEGGTSKNQLYVTLGKPSKAFHTTVHIATKTLKGLQKSAPADIVSRIWNEFSDRRLFRVEDVGETMPFQYWGVTCFSRPNESTPPPPEVMPCFEAKTVITKRDGRCGGWQRFMIDVLKTQGITGTPYDIVPKPFGNFEFKGLVVNPGPAQGIGAPHRVFTNHALVKYQGRIYDPSYGKDFDTLKLWENGSLERVFYMRQKDGPVIEEKENDEGTEEMEEYRPPPPPMPPPPGPPGGP